MLKWCRSTMDELGASSVSLLETKWRPEGGASSPAPLALTLGIWSVIVVHHIVEKLYLFSHFLLPDLLGELINPLDSLNEN